MKLMIVEDDDINRNDLRSEFNKLAQVNVVGAYRTGEDALEACRQELPDVILMDVQLLPGVMNGIETAVAIRREFPRCPVVFYSIEKQSAYFRAFRRAQFRTHYAYVYKLHYIYPDRILPLLTNAMQGFSFIDPAMEEEIEEDLQVDRQKPRLEKHEEAVARLLARGLSNEQIAQRLGYTNSRAISRINGAIYTALGLRDSDIDEGTARVRAALVIREGRLLEWDDAGDITLQDATGARVRWEK
ncbi:MAG TPA: response regulator transcription factor [Armatimonadota bacterium]|jgi:DNA-binding NarL/FixJ family response regulator